MGGAVQFIRRIDDVAFETSAGDEGTETASLIAAMKRGEWNCSIDAGFFTTPGCVLVRHRSAAPGFRSDLTEMMRSGA